MRLECLKLMETVRVILAEDHTLVRAGLCALVRGLEGVEVVAEAGDGHQALEMVGSHWPDLVLMDVAMPGLNGLEATVRIAKEYPHVKVIILSMHANEEYVLQSLRAGAVGYLLKDSGTAELELAIRAVLRGETFLSPAVSKHVIEQYVQRQEDPQSPFQILTPRQREILQLIAEGLSTKDIARKLDLSIKTIDTHRTQLMDRLDIHEVAGLVRYAVRTGLVTA
jgi:DNA-binding NarL/FixJ family response regulator